MTHIPHLLVVDDDVRLRLLLRQYLVKEGFYVSTAENITQAQQALALFAIDALIVDIMMPGGRGTELLSTENALPPILFLSAMGEAEDRIHALKMGGQDYMVKPFEPRELVLRLHNILRHRKRHITIGSLAYDLAQKMLFQENTPIALTTTESSLLHFFAEKANHTLSRDAILEAVFPSASNPRVVDVQINRLRKKIEALSGLSNILVSVRGKGYALKST